jgi:hypothetical protein
MGGNPILKKSKDIKELTNKDINELTNMDNHIDNQMVNQNPTKIKNDVNQNPTPSSSSSSSSSLKERKRKYKRKRNDTLSSKKLFGNILLTDEEYQKLKAKYNSHLDDVLNFINLKIESKGIAEWRKQYKSDYATILVWDRKGYLPQNIKKEGIFDD